MKIQNNYIFILMNTEKQDLIVKTYLDPKIGLSVKKVYDEIIKTYPKSTMKEVREVINNIEQVKTFKNKIQKDKYLPIVQIPNSFQADLLFLEQYKSFNNGIVGFLVIVNMNTKVIYVYPIKNKSQNTMYEKFKQFINEVKNVSIIETDKGIEFENKKVKDLFNLHKIKLVVFNKQLPQHKNSLSIAERMNRTIREAINKYLTLYHTNKYIDKLDDIVSGINGKKINITTELEHQIYDDNLKIRNKKLEDIEFNNPVYIGDNVKLLETKGIFDKGNKNKYSKNTYVVSKVVGTNYYVKDKDNKEIIAKPYQILKVDEEIKNPNVIKKTNTTKQLQNIKTKQKQKRILKKENIDNKNIVKKVRKRKVNIKT